MSIPPPPGAPTATDNNPSGPSRHAPTATEQVPGQEGRSSIRVPGPGTPRKKRNHRGGKKKRTRRQSFAMTSEDDESNVPESSQGRTNGKSSTRLSFPGLQGRNLSNTSLESETLLDHREQQSMRPRRPSMLQPSQSAYESPGAFRPQYSNPFSSQETAFKRKSPGYNDMDNVDQDADERTPMLSGSRPLRSAGSGTKQNRYGRNGSSSSGNSKRASTVLDRDRVLPFPAQSATGYNVNYPPSIPGTPTNRPMSFGDLMEREEFSPGRGRHDLDGRDDYRLDLTKSAPDERSIRSSQPSGFERLERRPTVAARAEEDVCFPTEDMSEIEEDNIPRKKDTSIRRESRRRRGKYPDLVVLDEWSRIEKEGRSDERRAKRMVEPQLIGGRLRPTQSRNWHRVEEESPYRFTYFNEEFPSTIHSQTISELVQPGGSFRELFIPDRPQLSDSSSDEEEEVYLPPEVSGLRHSTNGINGDSTTTTPHHGSVMENSGPNSTTPNGKLRTTASTPISKESLSSNNRDVSPASSLPRPAEDRQDISQANSAERTSSGTKSPEITPERPKRYGDRPTWWLDVLSPTDAEMKVLSKAFGIHPLTAEDILMQEAREKVELFRNYYLVNYRTFEQDMNNEDFLEPVNMYVVVFREGIISFHFSQTPHSANVRRRIRQLKDYLILSSDWISYAIIDDITDVFAPLIQNIEDEVDDIDDAVLMLHSSTSSDDYKNATDDKRSEAGGRSSETDGDMLRRVGNCRKKVMGLYRLLGNKADVIKGFAKRCNEHWDVAPRSEIGLYLGDIQDHIVTMTGNLSHYEKILSRSHGNYLAQINIRMNERQEQTADVLGKLTVLGTIVLPMNIITGLWGMNVWVPGQDAEGKLVWFWCITAGLLSFGFACFFMARTLYRIV